MSLDTGVDIKLQVTGEKLMKQAFESVRLAAKGLETQGLSLNAVLQKLEGTEKETINAYRKSSDTLKNVQKETVALARQYEILNKYSGISQREAKMLALAQDDLAKKADQLNYRGKVRTNYIESENKKIVEQIRLNRQLSASIEERNVREQASASLQKRLQREIFAGDNAVALFRANEIAKQKEVEKTQRMFMTFQKEKLEAERSMGDQMVALFRANELRKQREAERVSNQIIAQEQQRLAIQLTTGDQMVALFRANELRKRQESEKTFQQLSKQQAEKLAIEKTTGDQMVALFRANELKKTASIQKTQDAHVMAFRTAQAAAQRFAQVELNQVEKELKDIQRQAALTAQGLSRMTARGVIRLESNNATASQIAQFVELRRQIEALDAPTRRVTGSYRSLLGSFTSALPIAGAATFVALLGQVAVSAIRTADTMSLLRSRIALVKDESEDFNDVYSRLVETAVNNRSSLQDTATLYVRLTPALRAAGVEASAATKVIDSFQKTLLISGATTRETSSAILQFSQALAAGRLNGDEFRSISEAAPEFLRAFSRATGVAAGALKELAADGKLTTEVITAAMVIMNDELTKTAANIELTFSQSMTILSTRLSEFVDRANQATGATATLAGFTTDLSEIVKELNSSFALLDTASVNESLREMSPEAQAIGYVFETLAVVFLNTGFVLKTLVDTAVTGARQFKALVTGDLSGAIQLGQEYNQRAKEGAAFVEKLSNALVGATQRAAQARSELVQTRQSLLDMGYGASEMSGSLDGGSDSTKFLSKEMQDALAIIEKFKNGLSSSGKESEKFAKIQKKAIESLLGNLTKLEDQYSNYGGKIDDVERSEREIVKAFESGITTAAQYTQQIVRLSKVRQARSEIEYAEAQAQAAVEMNKVLEASDKQTEAYKDQVAEIEEQILKVGKQEEALLALELAKIDDIIATKQQKIEMNSFGDANDTLIGQYKEQIVELEKLKKAKSKLYETQEAQKVIEANAKIAKQLEDDIVRAFEKSFLEGADLAEGLKNAIKATFAKEVFRIFVQPVVGGLVSTFSGIFGGGGSDGSGSGTGGIGGLVSGGGSIFDNLGSFGSGFGTDAGTFADGFLAIGDKIANTFGDSALSDAIINNSELLGKVSAGLAAVGTGLSVFDSLKNGQYGSAIGEGLGYAFGGSIGGAVGKFLGGFVDKIFGFGGGKISATALPASFGQNVVSNLNEQYTNIVSSLGGTALTNVGFGAGGNTGRQGQNPNFTIGASVGGRGVFNSANTREGQADGLFLSGEIALNEANLADQSLRALFSVLKETDFADNIDAVIDSVDTFGDSFEKLQMALADAQLLKTINEEFPKLGGALATLAGQSIETVKTFVLLAGGFENLKNLQNTYISAIYSEEEKLALATRNLQTAFQSLGLSVPSTTADFKALVEAQNLTTVEGQATYLALLQLSGAFREISDAQTQAMEEQRRAAEQAAEALRREREEKISLAEESLRASISAERDRLNLIIENSKQIENELREVYNSQVASLNDTINKFTQFRDQLRKLKTDLTLRQGSESTTGLRSGFDSVVQRIRSGDESAFSEISGVTTSYLDSFQNYSSDFVAYAREFAFVQSTLSSLEEDANAQLTEAQQQLQALNSQVSSLIDISETTKTIEQLMIDLQAASAESILAEARLEELTLIEVQLLNDISQNVLSVADAIRNLIEAREFQGTIDSASVSTNSTSVAGFSTGGFVSGAGSSTSDSIPAMLSNGEFVVSSSAVNRIGVPALDMINRGIMPNNNSALISEIRALRSEVNLLRQENSAENRAIASNTGKVSRLLDDATDGGDALRTIQVQ